jgi:hypothetical protein
MTSPRPGDRTAVPGRYDRINGFHKKFESGASETFLLRANDRRSYGVKFREKAQSNELGICREYLAGQLASLVQASVPASRLLELEQDFIDSEPRLAFNDGTRPAPQVTAGLRFLAHVTDPPEWSARLAICPTSDLATVLVFNAWVRVDDRGEQNYAIYWDRSTVRFASIDYAESMNADSTSLPEVRDVDDIAAVAKSDWPAVDRTLTRLESLTEEQIDRVFAGLPTEWGIAGSYAELNAYLKAARSQVRAVVEALR